MRSGLRRFQRTWMAIAAAVAAACAAFTVSAGSGPDVALAPLSATRTTYLVVYQRGPSWVEGKPMREQEKMLDHFNYYIQLHRKGILLGAGGFTDESGGAAVFEAQTDAAARLIVSEDPAVTSKVFSYELQRWKLNPWEEISRKRAARGE
ncbi:MAG TPA: YciI family protein [Steroidobacteraceae bacterium]|nr:YciI family protein [Steroidobacteraceae bacterium]